MDSESSSTDRYRKAKQIALEALDLPSAARRAWLDQHCGNDSALRQETEWLIAAGEDAAEDDVPESFQAAARSALRQVSLEVPLPRNYRLLRRISQGGMGIVYLAERVDGDIRQQVAFKLLHLTEADNEAVIRRFATERGILSRLNHPWIAHLIDGGLTAEKRPFLATEFVDGEHIDSWCRQQKPDLDQRIALFLKVCQAVDYAHRHMVIHRDLKPGNILVTRSGEPKLLDFGIARLLDANEEKSSAAPASAQGLTLAYASPEQIEGSGLSASTDVYSLGVLLYELVTGINPFAGHADSALIQQAVLDGRFTPPSRVATGRANADLDAIIGMAMHRDAEQRYDSVRALADDLRRFQTHRPVIARGGGTFYRARRFVRRHRLSLSAAAVALLLLLVFLADREMQFERIAWERDRAEAVTRFMSELFAGADSLPSRGNEVTVREILDLGAHQLEQSSDSNPAMLGSMYMALGQAYNGLGLGEQALPLLERAHQALSEQAEPASQAVIQAEFAAAYDSAGRAAEAIAADQRAIALYRQAPGQHRSALLLSRIRELRNHGNLLDIPLNEVMSGLEAIVVELRAGPGDVELLFEAKAALVGARVIGRQAEAALGTAAEVRDLAEQLYREDDPRRLRGRYVYATALMLSDPEAAVAMYEGLIADHERMVGPSQRLANTIGNFGVGLARIGRYQDSMDSFARAAEMIEQSAGRNHYLYRLSVTNLAALKLRAGEAAEAERLVREILPDLEQRDRTLGGVETMYRVSALEVLADAERMQGREQAAAASYVEALDVLGGKEVEEWSALGARIAGKLEELRTGSGSD